MAVKMLAFITDEHLTYIINNDLLKNRFLDSFFEAILFFFKNFIQNEILTQVIDNNTIYANWYFNTIVYIQTSKYIKWKINFKYKKHQKTKENTK